MTITKEIVLDRDRIEALAWQPFDSLEGVSQRVLWHQEGTRSSVGMLRLEPGASIPPHTHRYSVHHVWIVSGTCEIEGRTLTAGSYAFVPAGVEHGIHDTGPSGCVMLYAYLAAEID